MSSTILTTGCSSLNVNVLNRMANSVVDMHCTRLEKISHDMDLAGHEFRERDAHLSVQFQTVHFCLGREYTE